MAVEERDRYSGYMTTGHEWNGITELNRPVPKVVWFFLPATVLFAVVYWILMPSWPLLHTHTKGILGVDERAELAESLRAAAQARSAWTRRIETLDYAEIQADEALMVAVRETGRTLFEDSCAGCHGMRGEGGPGFPRLTDGAWLWGGEPATVAETLRVGINSAHPETRRAQMPAFGRGGVLDRQALVDVVAFVRSLSVGDSTDGGVSASAAAGATVFAASCAVCHGADGTGNAALGAPSLADGFWIYGGDRQSVRTTVAEGRQGHMPHWEGRLSAVERKVLALFVLDLGPGGH